MDTNTLEGKAMKFVINRRTFNTATSSVAAVMRGVCDDAPVFVTGTEVRFEEVLYRTAKGALFAHVHKTTKYAKGKPVVTDRAHELCEDEVITWLDRYGVAIVDSTGLDLPPEA